jgi:hypothetical protein
MFAVVHGTFEIAGSNVNGRSKLMSGLCFIGFGFGGKGLFEMGKCFCGKFDPEILWFGKVYHYGQNWLFVGRLGAVGCSWPGVGVRLCCGLRQGRLGISRYYGMAGCASCGLCESLGHLDQSSKHQVSLPNNSMGVTFSVSNTRINEFCGFSPKKSQKFNLRTPDSKNYPSQRSLQQNSNPKMPEFRGRGYHDGSKVNPLVIWLAIIDLAHILI